MIQHGWEVSLLVWKEEHKLQGLEEKFSGKKNWYCRELKLAILHNEGLPELYAHMVVGWRRSRRVGNLSGPGGDNRAVHRTYRIWMDHLVEREWDRNHTFVKMIWDRILSREMVQLVRGLSISTRFKARFPNLISSPKTDWELYLST
jgi:hypothetical protein